MARAELGDDLAAGGLEKAVGLHIYEATLPRKD